MHDTAPHHASASTNRAAQATPINDLLIMPEHVETFRSAGLDTLDSLFHIENAESLTKPGLQSWRQRLRFELTHQGRKTTFYIKRFTHPPAAGQKEIRQAANGARSVAGIEWNWLRKLAAEGISCAKPVAFGEEIRRRREVRSAVVMEAVSGHSLEKWAASPCFSDGAVPPLPLGEGRGEGCDRPLMRNLLDESAQLVARFHARGYVHRDLYLAHIFYDPTAARDQSLCLIDLQRVFRPALWKSRWIVKDLAALNYSTPPHIASRADRLRWLAKYLQFGEPPTSVGADLSTSRSRLKRLGLRILGKTQSIARHDALRRERNDHRRTG